MSRLRARNGGDGYAPLLDGGSLAEGWDPGGRPGRSRWTRPGFIIGAVLLVVVALLGLRLWLFNDSPASTPTGPHPGAAPVVTADTPCPALPAAGSPPRSGADNDWTTVGLITAPRAPAVGPVQLLAVTGTDAAGQPTTARLGRCFAPGPAGALFAAANFLADLTDPTLTGPAIQQLTAPSAGRDALLAELASSPAALNAAGGTRYTFIGYSFQSRTDTQVTVALAIYTARGALGQVDVTVVRQGGDWHVVPPPSGNFGDVVHQIQALCSGPQSSTADCTSGFTGWRPPNG